MNRIYFIIVLFFSGILHAQPRVTIITSIQDNDDCIEGFLLNTFNQSLFYESEIIIIDNNSSGHEDILIKKYLKAFSHIKYIRLNNTHSLSDIINLGIKCSKAPYITYAYIHDRRTIFSLEEAILLLNNQTKVDVIYSNYCTTDTINAPWYDDDKDYQKVKPNSILRATRGKIGPQVVWRRTVHQRHGYFDSSFNQLALQEMWCRLISKGCNFYKADIISGLCVKLPIIKNEVENLGLVKRYGFF